MSDILNTIINYYGVKRVVRDVLDDKAACGIIAAGKAGVYPEVRDYIAKHLGQLDDDDTTFSPPNTCNCKGPPLEPAIKTSQGRYFYTCSRNLKQADGSYSGGCKFFVWGLLKPSLDEDDEPSCHCGFPAERKVVGKIGPNKGKAFFACSNKVKSGKTYTGGCQYFEWCKEAPIEAPKTHRKIIRVR
jgi:hypothetical protein